MAAPAAERKALLFSVAGVRLALRLSQVCEILPADPVGGEVAARGASLTVLPVAVALGLAGGPARFALVVEGEPPVALRVDALHGIVELADAAIIQLPSRTVLPQPPPFRDAIVAAGALALELDVTALGWTPLEPPLDAPPPPPAPGPAARELLFVRGGRTFAVPLALVVQIVEAPPIHPVPLTPASHLGLVHHDRALHAIVDAPAMHGDIPGEPRAGSVLLVDAGGVQIGLAADRIVGPGAAIDGVITRPSWDALTAA